MPSYLLLIYLKIKIDNSLSLLENITPLSLLMQFRFFKYDINVFLVLLWNILLFLEYFTLIISFSLVLLIFILKCPGITFLQMSGQLHMYLFNLRSINNFWKFTVTFFQVFFSYIYCFLI